MKLWKFIFKSFLLSKWNSSTKDKVGHLITRDINILIESLANIPNILYYFAGGIVLIATFYYINFLIGALLSISIFLVASRLISKKTSQYTNLIYIVSKERLKNVLLWIQSRNYFVNWKYDFSLSKKINKICETELELRNKDSMLKCFDFYMIVFLGTIPVAITIGLEYFLNFNIPFGNIGIYWFFIPISAFIMEAGRYTYDYSNCAHAMNALKGISSGKSHNKNEPLVIDDSWDIWEGSLQNNILSSDEPSELYMKLFDKLRLNAEFDTETGSDVSLSYGGDNISSGQKTRIILIRGLCLAHRFNLPIQINISFNSLDPYLCHQVLDILTLLSENIHITLENNIREHLIHQQRKLIEKPLIVNERKNKNILTNSQKIHCKFSNKEFLTSFYHLSSKRAFLFILSSFFASSLASLSGITLDPTIKILTLVMLPSFFLLFSSSIGVKIEANCRNLAKKYSTSILYKSSFEDEKDIFHRLSKDFTTMIERISWYVHDISWYLAVLITGLFFLFLDGSLFGLSASISFLILLYIVWDIYSNKIYILQQKLIIGINSAISGLKNYSSIGNIFPFWKNLSNQLKTGCINYRDSNIHLLKLKTNFTAIINLSSGLLLASAVIVFYFHQNMLGIPFILLISALILIDTTIATLFQAILGFNTQMISYKRLTIIPPIISFRKKFVSETNNYYKIKTVKDERTKLSFKSTKIKIGKVYSLLGESGFGKTTYLRTVAGLRYDSEWKKKYNQTSIPLYYLDSKAIELIRQIIYTQEDNNFDLTKTLNIFVTKIIQENGILALDEVLTELPLQDAMSIIVKYEELIKNHKCSIIIVDHRIHLEHSLLINNLLNIEQKEFI